MFTCTENSDLDVNFSDKVVLGQHVNVTITQSNPDKLITQIMTSLVKMPGLL